MFKKWANHQNKTRTGLVSRQWTEDADANYHTDDTYDTYDTDDTYDIDGTEIYEKNTERNKSKKKK